MKTDGDSLADVKIVLGVSGAIAAYKAVDLASKLVAKKAVVKTVMTENACKMVGEKSFEAITKNQVYTTLWAPSHDFCIGHIDLVTWADIVVIAPATANIIAKAAQGICDDILSTTICSCWNKAVLIAPTMNDNMWRNPAVGKNVTAIQKMGFEIIGPETGRLACGTNAIGRMAEPPQIVTKLAEMASLLG